MADTERDERDPHAEHIEHVRQTLEHDLELIEEDAKRAAVSGLRRIGPALAGLAAAVLLAYGLGRRLRARAIRKEERRAQRAIARL